MRVAERMIRVGLLILLLAAISVSSQAQQGSGKVAQIGFLGTDRSPSTLPREKAFL